MKINLNNIEQRVQFALAELAERLEAFYRNPDTHYRGAYRDAAIVQKQVLNKWGVDKYDLMMFA